MKKGIVHFLWGFIFLFPLGLSANALSNFEHFDLPAPEHLHVVNFGPDWMQLAWDEVPYAQIYQVTTREAVSGTIASTMYIDMPQINISGLQAESYLVSVRGIGNNLVGLESTIDVSLPLVFDLVLGKDVSLRPTTNCPVWCSFTNENPEATEFFCSNTELPNVPFLIAIKSSDPELGTLYFTADYEEKPAPANGYDIYLKELYADQNDWTYSISRIQWRNLLTLRPASGPPNANVRIEFFEYSLGILLPEGFQVTIYEFCDSVEGGDGATGRLTSQQNIPQIHESLSGHDSDLLNKTQATLPYQKNHGAFRVTNPVKNELELRFEKPTGEATILELYSMNGTLAARQQLPEGLNTYSLPASDLVPGTYLLRVHQDSGVETRLVIKQ